MTPSSLSDSFKKLPRAFPRSVSINPTRDWLILISLVLLLLIANIIINIFGFQQLVSRRNDITIPPSSAPAINEQAVQNVQQIFVTRASEQAKYESGAYSFTNPL